MTLIGTHNGSFHCDEVFGCYMLKKLPAFQNHQIIRTRDPKMLENCDVVLDVGGVYSHEKKRYDHHQREFNETMQSLGVFDEHTIRLSSAGLVYAHYGKEVLANILKSQAPKPENIEILYKKLYKCFVESIDAIDNGINQYDGTPRYLLASTLDSRVAHLNPAWNDTKSQPDEQFTKAMKLVGEEFEDRVAYMYNSWLPAREFVKQAIQKRKEFHESGQILFMEGSGLPYKQHFFEIEKEENLRDENISFVIFKDSIDSDSWRVQAIPIDETRGFDNRISLLWKGLRDRALETESGIKGAYFVHVNGFIGGARSLEGALEMAHKSLYNIKLSTAE